jgi:hypothetical protein
MTTDVALSETHPRLAEMMKSIHLAASFDTSPGGNDFVMDLMEQILRATSEDEIFELQESGMVAGKDFAGRPFLIKAEDIQWKNAGQTYIDQGAFPYYAIFKVTTMDTAEEVVVNCGGKTFVATIWALMNNNDGDALSPERFPDGRPLVIKANPSPNGAYLTVAPVRMPQPASGKRAR